MFCPKNDATDTIVAEGKKRDSIASFAAIVAVAIAAIIVAGILGGCGGDNAKSNDDVDSGEHAQQAVSSEEQKEKTLEDYTWEELSKISEEIGNAPDEGAAIEIAKGYKLTTEDGKLDGTQTKSITLSNGKKATVQIVGFAHDEKSDGGKAGITFIFKDCIGEHVMNSTPTNEGGWEKSEMRSYLNSEGLDLLPNDLKQEVVAVNKLTDNEGCSSQGFARSASPVTVTSDQLWLFSAVELSGTNNTEKAYSIPENETAIGAEGSEYKLFSDMNVDREDFEIEILQKSYQGSLCSWAGRTPFLNESSPFLGVNARGVPFIVIGANEPSGVVPGFCI